MLKELTLVLLPVLLFAQEKDVYQDSKFLNNLDSKNLALLERTNEARNYYRTKTDSRVTDTFYLVPDTTDLVINFAFYCQDRQFQWFKAQTDIVLKEVGISFYGIWSDSSPVELKIVKVNYPEDSLEYRRNRHYGWYEAIGNGYNDITAFLDDPDRTGGWIPYPGAPDTTEIFGNDIWSINGVGYSFFPVPDSFKVTYQWIDLGVLGYPEISGGDIFGVVLKNANTSVWGNQIKIRSTMYGTGSTPINQYSLWKFYAEDRNLQPPSNEYGWYSRDISLAYAIIVDKIVSVEDEITPSQGFELEQNYPNPFNPVTSLQYAVSSRQFVTLKVFDILGNEVATLVNEEKAAGSYDIEFNAVGLPSGIYFYTLKAANNIKTRKMILLK